MTYPSFAAGDVLTATDMNAVGLWLVKTQTVGTAVSSVTVSDTFNSNWTNYRVIYTEGVASANVDLKVTVGGKTAAYYGSAFGSTYAAGAFGGLGVNNAASWLYVGTATTAYALLDADIYQPYISGKNTFISSRWFYNFASSAYSMFVGELADTSSVNSITITPSSGTLTGGTIRIYGYRN